MAFWNRKPKTERKPLYTFAADTGWTKTDTGEVFSDEALRNKLKSDSQATYEFLYGSKSTPEPEPVAPTPESIPYGTTLKAVIDLLSDGEWHTEEEVDALIKADTRHSFDYLPFMRHRHVDYFLRSAGLLYEPEHYKGVNVGTTGRVRLPLKPDHAVSDTAAFSAEVSRNVAESLTTTAEAPKEHVTIRYRLIDSPDTCYTFSFPLLKQGDDTYPTTTVGLPGVPVFALSIEKSTGADATPHPTPNPNPNPVIEITPELEQKLFSSLVKGEDGYYTLAPTPELTRLLFPRCSKKDGE